MTNHVGERVLVPLDGSNFANAALRVAADAVADVGGELTLLLVVSNEFKNMTDRFALHERLTPERAAHSHLQRVASDIEHLNFNIVVRPSEDPAPVILTVAEELDATMIVMTTHGHTGLRKAIRGSVAQEVLRDAPIPVLMVPSTAEHGLNEKLRHPEAQT